MLLLTSDYDGTLKSDVKNLLINIDAIKNFQASGNIFAISTGRCYASIKREIDKYNIPCDYVMCNDGSVLVDNKGNLLHAYYMDRNDVDYLKFLLHDASGIQPYGTYDKTDFNDPNIVELSVSFLNRYHAIEALNALNNCGLDIKNIRFLTSMYIGANKSKSSGINILKDVINIPKENIYTVGDNTNDVDMLQDFNGYKILTCSPKIWKYNIPICREVHTLIRKLSK